VPEAMCYPRPLQEHVPILVGGTGSRTLRLAALRSSLQLHRRGRRSASKSPTRPSCEPTRRRASR
jgi:alkanesulfonate monooxygenase SsuD/methylene tetrahydromethanopterin reductase-like flavin-dependent oxidoreductase (luciferase family)